MNGYERFMTALRRGTPDRVPLWELIVNEPTLSTWGAASLEEFVEQEDLDAITVFEDVPVRPAETAPRTADGIPHPDAGAQHVIDDWGIVWGTTEHGIPYPVSGPIRNAEDLKKYEPPDPLADHRLATLRSAVQRFKGRRAIVFLTHDAFEFSHYLRGGMEHLLIDYVEAPHMAHALAEMAIDFKIRLMHRAIAVGADVVISGDDYASRMGPLMSPKHFREFVLPYLKRSVAAAHDAGVPYIKHTDGDIWRLMDMLVEAGIDAIDPLEPIARMDIGEVKRRYGDRLALVGNIDCTELLPHARPEDVVDAVKETIAKAAPGGGYILASSNSIHPGVKPDNYRTMVEAARRWGAYPLEAAFVEQYARKDYVARLLGPGH
jgi:uroporphyrinogen decarboxylase